MPHLPADRARFPARERPEPLAVDAVKVVAIGIGLWIIATVAVLVALPWLRSHGHGSWLWTCLWGIAIGFVGLALCWRRRSLLGVRIAARDDGGHAVQPQDKKEVSETR
jgi:hypothetical protein